MQQHGRDFPWWRQYFTIHRIAVLSRPHRESHPSNLNRPQLHPSHHGEETDRRHRRDLPLEPAIVSFPQYCVDVILV
jgi:hypothetical protein